MERHDASGARVMGDALRPIADATTVRKRGGKVLVTDGPFAETREWIAGFDILECADLDEAIEIASQHPMARFGRLELRPFWDGRARRPDAVTDGGARRATSAARSPTCMAAERLRIVATLIRTTGDWDLAEDAVADAAERALERWPRRRHPRPSGGVADDHRPPPRHRRPPPPRHRTHEARRARHARTIRTTSPTRDGTDRRRSAPARLHVLPSRAVDGGAGRAHAARSCRTCRRRRSAGSS